MAVRIVAIPIKKELGVKIHRIDLRWEKGMNITQKRKNIMNLHSKIREVFGKDVKILEISTKSPNELGRSLSSLNLKIDLRKLVPLKRLREIGRWKVPVELVFQGSKVFENKGPYLEEFLSLDSREWRSVKKRLPKSKKIKLLGFKLFGEEWPLEPKTLFYDWLYINALMQNMDIAEKLMKYDMFTDIEFNPEKSINCQAITAAIYVSLRTTNLLPLNEEVLKKEDFIRLVEKEDLYSKVRFQDRS